MIWFQHDTDLHNRPFMSKAIELYGNTAYTFYLVIIEIYAKNYNYTDNYDQLTVTIKQLCESIRVKKKKMNLLLEYFQKESKIVYKKEGLEIIYKIPNIKEIASNWTKRKERRNSVETTEVPTAKEENRIENNIIEKEISYFENEILNLKEKNYGDVVKLTEKQYLDLIKDYGEEKSSPKSSVNSHLCV